MKRRDWKKADFRSMRADLGLDWERLLEGKDVNDTWYVIREKIKNAMNRNIPWRRVGQRERPRWWSNKIANLISQKKKLWNKSKNTGQENAKRPYKRAENLLKKTIKNAKKKL